MTNGNPSSEVRLTNHIIDFQAQKRKPKNLSTRQQAEALGLKERQAWQAEGREVIKGSAPEAIVFGETEKVCGLMPWYVVAEDLGSNMYRIKVKPTAVYSLAQTEPRAPRMARQQPAA